MAFLSLSDFLELKICSTNHWICDYFLQEILEFYKNYQNALISAHYTKITKIDLILRKYPLFHFSPGTKSIKLVPIPVVYFKNLIR